MKFIVTGSTDADIVGGKAASLARLAAAGFNPPAFFTITADAFRAGRSGPTAQSGLRPALSKALKTLGEGPFAVRSSGHAEDGADHSHAGQFDTVLNVAAGDVLAATKQVWQSGFSDTVATYRAVRSGGAAAAPAIVVQRMIAAQVSGVAFSADPVSGRRDLVVISAIAGFGDALVSGEEDGQTWIIGAEPQSPNAQSPNAQAPDDPILTPEQVTAVADLARRAQAYFGTPQDIEWAIDANGLHILQARPITTPLRALPKDDTALTIFDNSNIVESYPGMVSPLTYSFAVHVYARVYRAFVRLLGVRDTTIAANGAVFDNMLGRLDGRVYYNLVNWYRALALLPGFALNRAYMETMMGVSEPMPDEITQSIGPAPLTGWRKGREYLRVGHVGLRLLWSAFRLPATRRGFYARLNTALNSDLDLETATPTQLAAEYRQIESTLLDRWDAPLVNDFLCMIAFGASRNMLEKWLGPDGLKLHNDLMIGQGDIVSAEPAQRIAKMGALVPDGVTDQTFEAALAGCSALKIEYDSYLAKFGDRCTEELKLESIPLTQDPAQLIYAILAHAQRPATAHAAARDPDWQALFPRNPLRRFVAKHVIRWTKSRVRDRENLRFERTRIFGHARQVFLAMGREFAARGLIDQPRDVFHLTTHEVLGAVEGFGLSSDLKSVIGQRQAEDVASSARADPAARIEIRGPAIYVPQTAKAAAVQTGSTRSGTGCSAGTVTARARVIRDPRTERLDPGDILVARHTDPGWIAVFSNASAIVVERGSLLSHSAIVARELGIPCVVGLKDATLWVKNGEQLQVDGATGEVRKHDF